MTRTRLAAMAAALILATATLSGCGDGGGRTAPSTQQGVSDVMKEQMQQDEQVAPEKGAFVGDKGPAFEQVDYDLTAMGSDMVYATVYDMMANPTQYEGKVVKMGGPYYHTFYEDTGMDYFFVIIEDATACCTQGMEFVWGDGSHAFPGEYPEDGTQVVVTGKFEVYTEDAAKYVHLVDASLEAA